MAESVRYTNNLESPIVHCIVRFDASLCLAGCVAQLAVLRLWDVK